MVRPPTPPAGPPPNSPWAARPNIAWGVSQHDPMRGPPSPYGATSPAPGMAPSSAAQAGVVDQTPWRVTTTPRSLGMQLFIGVFGAMVIGAFAHGGDPNQEGGGAASDALFSTGSMIAALCVATLVIVVNVMKSVTLEGTAEWIGRVKPPLRIALSEIVHVSRTRPLKLRNKKSGAISEARTLSYKIATADGRRLSIPEAAVHRQPRLLQFYDAAMEVALHVVSQMLAAGTPLTNDEVVLYADRLLWKSGGQVALRDIGKVQVTVGEGVTISVVDRTGKALAALPDDELMLRALICLGVPVDERRDQSV